MCVRHGATCACRWDSVSHGRVCVSYYECMCVRVHSCVCVCMCVCTGRQLAMLPWGRPQSGSGAAPQTFPQAAPTRPPAHARGLLLPAAGWSWMAASSEGTFVFSRSPSLYNCFHVFPLICCLKSMPTHSTPPHAEQSSAPGMQMGAGWAGVRDRQVRTH